jgi:geranylgeranyl diphosphate synthase, type II
MSPVNRIEQALEVALANGHREGCPPKLAAAVRHSVFPGGARIRPQLCLAVASACGDPLPAVTDAAAAAIELLHCASLVHDDLPCFDNADTRRGLPSVHRAYGERLAVLSGDALIVMAFQTLGKIAELAPARFVAIFTTVSESVGMPFGIVAGQAWECESRVSLRDYQQAKTGVLFAAATAAGAEAAGAPSAAWRLFGDRLGEAYQIADDLNDVVADPLTLGKPVGRDLELGRPSCASEYGLDGALMYFETSMAAALASIPECPGARRLRELVRAESERIVPASLRARHKVLAGNPELANQFQ